MSEKDPDYEVPAGEESLARAPVSSDPSLTDDVVALFDDTKTYLEAELQFQKTRAAFALERGRSGALYGIVAFAVLHLALVALVVGAVIALTPAIGPWGATGVVVGLLMVCGILLALSAKHKFSRLAAAYRDTRE